MSIIGMSQDAALLDSTPIENMFIIEYLPEAPEEYLRVYLYVRMVCLHPEIGDSLPDLARALHMEEEKITDAFAYWEQQGLMLRTQDNPVRYEMMPVRAARVPEDPAYELRDMNMRLQGIFGSNLLHPQEYLTSAEWVKELGFTEDAVICFVETRARRLKSKKPDLNKLFKKLDQEAARLADKGVRTKEQMLLALAEGGADDVAEEVLRRFSIRRAPTGDELALARKWTEEWALKKDAILDACRETVRAREPSFAYLDKVLENRRSGDNEEVAREIKRELGNATPPSPDEKKTIQDWMSDGFEKDTLVLAAIQCCRKMRHSFEDLSWMISAWKKEGLFRKEDAEAYIEENRRLTQEVQTLLETAGSGRRAQLADVTSYAAWKKKYPAELILYAAECARGMTVPIRYMDKLLSTWETDGVRDVAAAQAAREKQRGQGSAAQPARSNPALNYAQHQYSESDFNGLYVDLGGEGDGK